MALVFWCALEELSYFMFYYVPRFCSWQSYLMFIWRYPKFKICVLAYVYVIFFHSKALYPNVTPRILGGFIRVAGDMACEEIWYYKTSPLGLPMLFYTPVSIPCQELWDIQNIPLWNNLIFFSKYLEYSCLFCKLSCVSTCTGHPIISWHFHKEKRILNYIYIYIYITIFFSF